MIGPAFALWTRVFGYSEWSPRLFTLLLTITTTFLLFVAFYKSFGLLFASVFSALFAALPLIYIYGKETIEGLVIPIEKSGFEIGIIHAN